jgi:hypothetical protein
MKTIIHTKFLACCIVVLLFSAQIAHSQIFATSQANGANGTCVGCNVSNPANATDGNGATHSTINLTVGVLGAFVYQDLIFSATSSSSKYIRVFVENNNLSALNSTVLGSVDLLVYNGATLQETVTSATYTITLLSGSTTKYVLEFNACCAFTKVSVKMNAGIASTTSNLRVYYANYNITPLPISLLSFTAMLAGSSTKLQWVTASERNNDYFTIERSPDGITYTTIAQIKGAGNSDSRIIYDATDNNPLFGVSYYRLKQTDIDGTSTISSLVGISRANKASIPVKVISSGAGQISIAWETATTNVIVVQVYNLLGQQVYETKLPAAESAGSITLDQTFNQGIYLVGMSGTEGLVPTQKIVVP